MTSPFLPGVTHHFTNLRAFSDEIANARICAGFHYRFSTIAGRAMGQKIGTYVIKTSSDWGVAWGATSSCNAGRIALPHRGMLILTSQLRPCPGGDEPPGGAP